MSILNATLLLVITLTVYIAVNVSGMPTEKDGAEIIMKIEQINQQLPGVQASQQDKATVDGASKPKKSQRNYPVYYVNTKQNGKFGKSVRAFTSEEFFEKYGKH